MEVIFLFGTVQAFFLSFLVFTKKNKSTADYVLGAWMAFIGLHLLDFYFHSTGLAFQYPHLLGLGVSFPMLEGPFMFVYILVMINKTGRLKPAYLLHALPFLFFTVYLAWDFYFLNASEKLAYYRAQQNINFGPILRALSFGNVFLGPAYVVWSLFKLRKHSKNISEQFSYTEQINLNWLKYVVAGLGFVWITVLITKIGIFSPFLTFDWENRLIYLSVTIAVFFLGFFGLKQQTIYINEPGRVGNRVALTKQNGEIPAERYKKSGLSEQNAKEYLHRLLQFLDEEKPYLNGKLSLKDVAAQLSISINHLSQVINGQLGVSFFNLINKYRVDEVKSRITNPEYRQLTLLAIAYDCGFNSKSSFNNIFKKATGLTPSQFIKEKCPIQ